MADNITYRFIQNVGDYFPSGYFTDDFINKVQSCAGYSADDMKALCSPYVQIYNPQIQISAESGTKRSIFRQKNKTKRSKKRLHTTLIKPEQKVNEDLCSGFIVS